MVICSYRDDGDELPKALQETIDAIKESDNDTTTITLGAMSYSDVQALLADSLYSSQNDVEALSHLVVNKTAGNPFHVHAFLRFLHTQNLIYLDTSQGRWRWDTHRINQQNITENVVELMCEAVQKLPEQTQHILKYASCIGNTFDLNILSIICDSSPSQIAKDLWPALKDGFIIPVGEGHQLLQEAEGSGSNSNSNSLSPSYNRNRRMSTQTMNRKALLIVDKVSF